MYSKGHLVSVNRLLRSKRSVFSLQGKTGSIMMLMSRFVSRENGFPIVGHNEVKNRQLSPFD